MLPCSHVWRESKPALTELSLSDNTLVEVFRSIVESSMTAHWPQWPILVGLVTSTQASLNQTSLKKVAWHYYQENTTTTSCRYIWGKKGYSTLIIYFPQKKKNCHFSSPYNSQCTYVCWLQNNMMIKIIYWIINSKLFQDHCERNYD